MEATEPAKGGVGLGLRFEILDDVLARVGEGVEMEGLDFFEVAPENYMRRGGFVPAALEQIAARFPLLTHGLTLSIGGVEPLDEAYLGELQSFLGRHHAPYHSDHLCFSAAAGRFVHDLLPLPFTRRAASHVAARAKQVEDRIGAPLLLENVTRYVIPGRAEMSEAEFIREVLERSGARLLLDVNNAYVNALNDGSDPYKFVESLPLDRVGAVHVAGHERVEAYGLVIDTHGADVVDPVLALLEWTIARTGPVPVVLERDNAIPPLDALLEEMRRVRRAYHAGLGAWEARGNGR